MRLWRTTKHENRVQRASYVEMGQSVIQASVVGDCLKVGSLCDDTDPADKTDGARFQQMGGPALAQRMRRNPLADAGATCSFATCDPDGLVANRLIEPAAKSACGKQV